MADRSLDGYVVGVTADRRAEEQSELLTRRGATVVHGPVIRTLPFSSDETLRAITASLIERPCDYFIANTGIGMRGWFSAAESWGMEERLLSALAAGQVLCRGPKAAGAVSAVGLPVWWRAPGEELHEVIDHLLAEADVGGCRVGVQLDGGHGAGDVAERLAAAGAEVIGVPVYRWTLPEDDRPAVRLAEAAVSGAVQAVTFTAAPAVENLFQLAASVGLAHGLATALNGPVVAACVGPVCARAARAHGVHDPLVPDVARLGTMVRALAKRLARSTRALTLAGVPVEVRGTVVDVAGERVELRTQERALLRALSERPGAVVSHERLLEAVSTAGDGRHALDVAVTRLRSRLGLAGAGVVSVPRRGYRLDAG